jgi:hypothetical protein
MSLHTARVEWIDIVARKVPVKPVEDMASPVVAQIAWDVG